MKNYEEMMPHEQRVVNEQKALNELVQKLQSFVSSSAYNNVDKPERDRLMRQLSFYRCMVELLKSNGGTLELRVKGELRHTITLVEHKAATETTS